MGDTRPCPFCAEPIKTAAVIKEQAFEVRKVVFEKDGLWWLASGEFGDGEDAALEEFLRARQA